MNKLLLGAAAALAIAAPGIASAQSANVDLSYTNADSEVGGLDFDDDSFALSGAYSWGGNGGFGGQVDGVVSTTDDDDTAVALGGHLFTRSTNHLVGGFARVGTFDPDIGADYDFWTLGAEGQWYLDRTTFDGALSYSEADDIDTNLTALDLGVTHFVTDKFSFGGNVGVGEVEIAGADADTIAYGFGAEYQFGVPISIFGGWQHTEIDDFDTESDALTVGVRYDFGGTLLERNRAGAGLSRTTGIGRFAGVL